MRQSDRYQQCVSRRTLWIHRFTSVTKYEGDIFYMLLYDDIIYEIMVNKYCSLNQI